MSRKRFEPGDQVEVRRNTSSEVWEKAVYKKPPATDWRGWHAVELDADATPRRIDVMTGNEVDRHSSPEVQARAFETRFLFVPTRRIRLPNK